jgi:hypothetical protein
MTALHYDSYTGARTHLKELLNAAEQGRPATVRHDAATAMVVDANRLRRLLFDIYPSRAQVVAEAGGWSVFISGLPVAADGASFDEAASGTEHTRTAASPSLQPRHCLQTSCTSCSPASASSHSSSIPARARATPSDPHPAGNPRPPPGTQPHPHAPEQEAGLHAKRPRKARASRY